jgi:fermentation-respiration switch protein FrsA (DUF1100 family)
MAIRAGKKEIMEIIGWIFLIYLAVVLFMYINQRNYIYFTTPISFNPQTHAIDDLRIVQIIHKDEDLELTSWYVPSRKVDFPTIVYFHGNASNLAMSIEKGRPFIDHGYGFLIAEYRGYSGNLGKPSEDNLYKDARGWIEWLFNEQSLSQNDLILYGESLGTGIAVQMASEYKAIQALVLEAPYTTLPDVGQSAYKILPVTLLMKDKYNSIEKIKSVKAPMLFLHGKKDNVVPFKFGKTLYDAAVSNKKLISYDVGNHWNLYNLGAFSEIIKFFHSLKN